MNLSMWARQWHWWLSIAFTAAVIANFVALALDSEGIWVGLVALVPLFALPVTVLYLFALPCLARRAGA